MQTLKFENLHWPGSNPDAAHYECEGCGRAIQNHAKTWMLKRGEWRAHNEGTDRKIRGFHISSLYSPVGWLSWAQVASKYEKCGKDREKLQVFWNTVLGLPWADQGEAPEVDRLYERRENYVFGTVPKGGLMLTAGVDVQMKRLEVEIVAWGRSKQSWSIDYRILEGDTNQPDVWAKLKLLLDEEFPSEYGASMRIAKLAVDTGFNTMRVYDFVRESGPSRVMGIKGDTRTSSLIGHPSLIEVGPQGRRLKYGVRLWPINVSIAKDELYRWLKTSVPDIQRGETWPTGFCHFPQYGKEYFDQICSEQLVTKLKGGVKKTGWEKVRDRNEALDARIYARAAAVSLRMDAWPVEKWDQLQRSLTRDKQEPEPLKQAPAISRTPMPVFKPIRATDSFLE
jgi:phage terminase large subunit GpA-like protein